MNVAQEAITAILKPLVLIQKGVILVLVMPDLLEMESVVEVGIIQWRIQDFPLGGADPLGGGADLQRGHFLVEMSAKMKEFGPIGGGGGPHAGGTPLDPPILL